MYDHVSPFQNDFGSHIKNRTIFGVLRNRNLKRAPEIQLQLQFSSNHFLLMASTKMTKARCFSWNDVSVPIDYGLVEMTSSDAKQHQHNVIYLVAMWLKCEPQREIKTNCGRKVLNVFSLVCPYEIRQTTENCVRNTEFL